MSNPTPGPWAYDPYHGVVHEALIGELARIEPQEGGEDDANGYLMAAAPTLFKACEEALRWHTTPGSGFESYLAEGLKAALAAARGNAP